MKRMGWLVAAALSVTLSLVSASDAQTKKQVVIGATSSASSVFVYFVSLAKAINQYEPTLNATVVETGATVDNLRRMERGQIDVGLATGETTGMKYEGV
jgi:uncharacterized protein